MTESESGVIDTHLEGSIAATITMTDETQLTMYVVGKDGAHKRDRVTLQLSPDGVSWFDDDFIKGTGYLTVNVCAMCARAIVTEIEKEESHSEVFIIAR